MTGHLRSLAFVRNKAYGSAPEPGPGVIEGGAGSEHDAVGVSSRAYRNCRRCKRLAARGLRCLSGYTCSWRHGPRRTVHRLHNAPLRCPRRALSTPCRQLPGRVEWPDAEDPVVRPRPIEHWQDTDAVGRAPRAAAAALQADEASRGVLG